MNGVGFEILARTPVPKLPLSYTPYPSPAHTPEVCCVYSLESPDRGNSNEYPKDTNFIENQNDIPKLSRFASWHGAI